MNGPRAGVAEQVDARVSKTRSFGSVSSSLTARTTSDLREGSRHGDGDLSARTGLCSPAGVGSRRAPGNPGAFPSRVRAPVRVLAQADRRDRCGQGADRAGNRAPIREGAWPRRRHLARDRGQLSTPQRTGGGLGAEIGGRGSGVLIPRCVRNGRGRCVTSARRPASRSSSGNGAGHGRMLDGREWSQWPGGRTVRRMVGPANSNQTLNVSTVSVLMRASKAL